MNWINYLLEANLYMVIFYVLYVLLLRSETLYQLNRAYLLVTSALAFVIPLLQLGVLKPTPQNAPVSVGEISYGVVSAAPVVVEAPKWTMEQYLLLGYGLVASALFIHLAIRVYLLMALSKKGSVKKDKGFKVIELHQGSVAFSFFNNLFIDDRLSSSQTILYHEQVHIRQKHSWDIIYLELLKIVNWFNPVIYLMIASMKELHEFIADEQTVALESNNDTYTDFLISNAYGITQNPLTNSFFNKNLLKRRITMLYQKRSGKAARLKYLLALPLLGGTLCLSTMAFTNKTYGWVDLVPKSPVKFAEAPLLTAPASENKKAPGTITKADTTKQHVKVTDIVLAPPANDNHSKHSQPVRITNIVLSSPPPDKNPASGQPTQIANIVLRSPQTTADTTKTKGEPIFTAVEISPQFPGGEAEFGKFLRENIRYPKIDHDNNVQGRVYINFIVEKDGSLSNFKVVRAPSTTLGDEAFRVVSLSPKWTPGIQNGTHPVRVSYTIPINFSLGNSTTPPVASKINFPEIAVMNTNNGSNIAHAAVETQPQYPGGNSEFARFLGQNIRYPTEAKKNKIEGRVYVQFIVEMDGSLSDIKIARSPSNDLSEEAMRVIRLSSKWMPGTQNGKPVRVQYTVPINFSLGNQ